MRLIKLGLFLIFLLTTTCVFAQCKDEITPIPFKIQHVQGHTVHLPNRDFVRYAYPLSTTDEILFVAHATSIGSHDREILVSHDGMTAERLLLRNLPEMHHDAFYADSFTALTVTKACTGSVPVYFIAMGYAGDITSGDLFLTVVPMKSGYKISALPITSGGILDISKSDPSSIRTWSNLHEGSCNACPTRYLVTEYTLQKGKPIETKHYRTHRLFTSSQFDDRRRVRFIP